MSAPSFYVVDYLLSQSESILDKLADEDSNWGRLILRDELPLKLFGTGKRAITVSDGTPADYDAHAYGSSVNVRIYADHTRDTNGNAPQEDGIDRCWLMYNQLDQLLHQPGMVIVVSANFYVQSDRVSGALPSFDEQQQLPYITANFEIAVLVSV